MKRSFFLIKPDAVLAGQVEEILNFMEVIGFKVWARKSMVLQRRDVAFLYPMHVSQDFFDDLVAFMVSGPSELLIVEKDSAVENLNKLVGTTDPKENGKDTIRGRFGSNIRRNAVHSPNSPENAVKETLFFFPEIDHDF